MKKIFLLSLILLFSTGINQKALADEPEVIELWPVAVEEETPTPVPEGKLEIRTYAHDQKDVERLARLLWSSPLRDEEEKEKLLWCVFNRMYTNRAGYDFGSTVKEVVCQNEFGFFDPHAHRSAENLGLAEAVWNKYQSMMDGCYVGKHPSNLGIFIRFSDDKRSIDLLSTKDGAPLK